ncbi:hypothetical protein C4E15_14980 [Achromobacter spanius]|uniref:Uncharacterized protein n=1 Tax=Achromobacter spanius TaxID=217203 RepID=A0A2S5GRD5_9BURK|nr:DUF5677 domain-containing protein [Achromobacter spanius]PPA75401.1 hypothetical protein C4E15_14980 [Achromobacter spanius]
MDTDDFKRCGFLSSHLGSVVSFDAGRFAEPFTRCTELSDAATKELFAYAGRWEDREWAALGFWARCVSSCQGALLLADRGMEVESMALTRLAYEALFTSLAVLKDLTVLERLKQNEAMSRVLAARGMIEGAANMFSEQQLNELQEVIEENASPAFNSIKIKVLATAAGMLHLYETVYRSLSLTAAHPTLSSLDHLLEDGATGQPSLTLGPSANNLEWTLELIRMCLELGMTEVHSRLHRRAI